MCGLTPLCCWISRVKNDAGRLLASAARAAVPQSLVFDNVAPCGRSEPAARAASEAELTAPTAMSGTEVTGRSDDDVTLAPVTTQAATHKAATRIDLSPPFSFGMRDC